MLVIEDLQVTVGDRIILKNINLKIVPGETQVLFGPNGSGKTSLLMTIMGYPQYVIAGGRILFKGSDITRLPVDERAKMGIGILHQRPPTIHGVKTMELAGMCAKPGTDIPDLARQLNFNGLLNRDVNDAFSGGEIKRSELLQLMAQDPDLFLFDEPESGVDIENIALIGNTISRLLQRDFRRNTRKSQKELQEQRQKMGLVITHTGFIMDYITAEKGIVLYNGELTCVNNPREIFRCISEAGYRECVKCAV